MQHFSLELHLNTRKDKDKLSDRLLKACIQGDRKAQRKLYEQLAPKMFPVCLRYMNNREMAEDVMQDGFVTLFSKLDSYSGTGSFEGWARKIFVNTALMQLRYCQEAAGSCKLRGTACRTWPLQGLPPARAVCRGWRRTLLQECSL